MSSPCESPPTAPAQLWLVAPDRTEHRLLQTALRRHGHDVRSSQDPQDVEGAARRGAQLLMLDPRVEPMRPGRLDCWWRLARLREQHRRLPVIVLQPAHTAIDRSLAYELGADAVCDPLADPRELQAQVHALLRRYRHEPGGGCRAHAPHAGPRADLGARAMGGDWTLDAASRSLQARNGMRVPLSPAEYRLLCAFLDHAGHALARQALIDLARGVGADQLERNVDLLVSRLRKKLSDEAGLPPAIRTVRGVGYLFAGLEG